MDRFSLVGDSPPRLDAADKARGRTRFAADIKIPGTLIGKLLRSPLPHALIRSVDTSRAERLPGVRAVVTHVDIPFVRYGPYLKDQTLLAQERVRFVGEPVAAVAAADEETARAALDLIHVEYEPLPVVLDPVEAMQREAILVHPEFPRYQPSWPWGPVRDGNVCCHASIERGNVEEAFAEADLVFEDTFTTHAAYQAYLEHQAAVAQIDGSGRLLIRCTSQLPFMTRNLLSQVLGLPMSRVCVEVLPVGGGFGGKTELCLEPFCGMLALKSFRPVQMQMSQHEELTAGHPRHPSRIEIKSAMRVDGTILGRQAKLVFDTGAYAGRGPGATSLSATHVLGPYRISHVRVDSYCVYTNKLSFGAYRGPGGSQAVFAVESHMDRIARALGVDPLDLRLRNALSNGDESPTGQRLWGVGLREALRRVSERAGWGDEKGLRWETTPGKVRGRGLACAWAMGGHGSASAQVKANEDGTVSLITGATDIGTGNKYTSLAQIAAEELKLPLTSVAVAEGDTDSLPFDRGTGASRVTFSVGSAVRQASLDLKRQLLQMAAERLEANPDDLDWDGEAVYVRGSRELCVLRTELIAQAIGRNGHLTGFGTFCPQKPAFDGRFVGHAWPAMYATTFGAHIAEVEVDLETGRIEVLRLVAAQDVGRAINPMAVEGQMEGAAVQGAGFAISEELIFQNGEVANSHLADYLLPTAVDAPLVETLIVEAPTAEGPYGAKGVGDAVAIHSAAAVISAVSNALGVEVRSLPLKPERVLSLLTR